MNERAIPRHLEVTVPAVEIAGRALEEVRLGGYAYGPPIGEAETFMLVGGITAPPFPFGRPGAAAEGERRGWWDALRGPDLIDLERHTVLCPTWPGNGTHWEGLVDRPSEGELELLPRLSVLDLADLVARWLEGLGMNAPLTYVGASLGGLVGIALAARHPKRVHRLVSVSAGLRPDGWGTATRHLQRELVRDASRAGDVATGMNRARQLGMLTYRSRLELDTRFGRMLPGQNSPPVASYLDHHGQRFAEAFPASTFLMLSEAIDRCTLADDEAGVRSQLRAVSAEVHVIGVPGDLLFPWSLQHELHRELQAVGATSHLWKLDSEYGHDAFLADQDRLADVLRASGALITSGATRPSERFQGVGRQPLREVRLGLIGLGSVGTGLLELLESEEKALADRYGVRFRVTKVAVRDLDKPRTPRADGIPRTDRARSLVSAPDVDVIVEVAGGLAPLDEVLRAALAAGKPVVTANKALLAQQLDELGVLAQRTETPLACEGAVAAALPILRHLNHRGDEVERLLGIVNGTCNYLITRLEQDELPLERALAEAQGLGLVETDPSMDVDGHDAAAKLSILTYRSFGAWFRPDTFAVRGIRELTPADCDLAESMGFRIRHLARAAREGDAIDLAVEPLLLPDWHLLANVEEEYNAIYLVCPAAGDLSFFGKGAGGLPTATAVLSDLIDLAQDNSARWPVPNQLDRAKAPPRRVYLRASAEPHPGLSRRVESHLRRAGLVVESRATRSEKGVLHLAWIVAPTPSEPVEAAIAPIRRLERVADTLVLGVVDS